ncbi:hypothetical protein L204_103127 [Cryptococcus depauperatus]
MSMHFAPQWAKPIKPSGTSTITTPTTELPGRKTPTSAIFPALAGNSRSASPTISTHPTLSYSRVTHMPSSPSVATDGYFPNTEINGEINSHPFRYSREQILALFDENKFKERPIELVEMAGGGGVLVNKSLNKPVGLRELSETEKKILASSVHPTLPTRRQIQQSNSASGENAGLPTRRSTGYTRGEGGAFNGSMGKMGSFGGNILSPGGSDHKSPGALGGGFGGVGKRMNRRNDDHGGESRTSAATWRSTPKTPGSSFEGVLGFGHNGPPTEPIEPKEIGQRKWRIAAGLSASNTDRTLEVPITSEAATSVSVIATPSATPIPERDASVLEPSPTLTPSKPQQSTRLPSTAARSSHDPPEEDLGAAEWYYRDPNGQEQGPFTGTQMHDWHAHKYFADDLPIRRASESTYRPLAELKTATGSEDHPFLTPVRIRQLPVNLPLPLSLGSPQQNTVHNLPDNFRNLAVQSPLDNDSRVSSQPHLPSGPGPFTPDFDAFSPNYPLTHQPNPLSSGYTHSPSQTWNALNPGPQGLRMGLSPMSPVSQTPFHSSGVPSPIGSAPLQYMQQQLQHLSQQRDYGMRSAHGEIYGQTWNQPQGYPQQASFQQTPQQPQTAPMQGWEQPQFQQIPQKPQPVAQPQFDAAYTQDQSAPTRQIEPVMEAQPLLSEAQAKHTSEHEHEIELMQSKSVMEETIATSSPVSVTPEPVLPLTQNVWAKTYQKASAPSVTGFPAPGTVGQTATIPKNIEDAATIIPTPTQLPQAIDVATPGPTSSDASSVEKIKPKVAPWAVKVEERTAPSLSLRDIQEAEAKRAEVKRAALAEARVASASPKPASIKDDELPASMSWGLASQSKGVAGLGASATVPSPILPVWGGAGDAPKKTLKQIQAEEEHRKTKATQAARLVQGHNAGAGVSVGTRRGYADLAAAPVKKDESLPGWSTVGAGGRVTSAATTFKTTTPVKAAIPVAPKSMSVPVAVATTVKKTNGPVSLADDSAPSVEFIRWTKQALTGFKGDVDDFISVLLSFPIDPPAAAKADQMEIISDSVYANSSTLDGRRFAQEFMMKRKTDAKANKIQGGQKIQSLADVVKTQPKMKDDTGFKIVKAKGKKKN